MVENSNEPRQLKPRNSTSIYRRTMEEADEHQKRGSHVLVQGVINFLKSKSRPATDELPSPRELGTSGLLVDVRRCLVIPAVTDHRSEGVGARVVGRTPDFSGVGRGLELAARSSGPEVVIGDICSQIISIDELIPPWEIGTSVVGIDSDWKAAFQDACNHKSQVIGRRPSDT
ncbi:hypothetical protein F511_44599 [Dorcoceras hygrometricum]|uniref:Uncharacterized protein n=1 Tax=Dorcoceras hygrometricum TaxID=472368 RepID=A0A2Z6ZXN9_9LAMI|nr:hypothetical protein F511_44599 [Dorcoceras hygrometricum]